MHNGELNQHQQWRAALINCGPGAVLTGLAAAQRHGLHGWETEHIDVLVADRLADAIRYPAFRSGCTGPVERLLPRSIAPGSCIA